jgi:hypothetical protein
VPNTRTNSRALFRPPPPPGRRLGSLRRPPQSEVTPEGPRPVADWVQYWERLHAGFSGARGDVWDAYMWNSQTFYVRLFVRFVPFLSSFS